MTVRKVRTLGNNTMTTEGKQIMIGKLTWKDYIMIEPESKKKAIFDVFVLFLVGYSCVTSVYSVAFKFDDTTPVDYNTFETYFDLFVEGIFFLDLFLNFIWAYINPDTQEEVRDLKLIAKEYIFHGWFFVDFMAVFPFSFIIPGTGKTTKLFRLFRLPRLLKLFSISKFSQMIKNMLSNSSQRDEKIVA